jgi:anaphase-promoting complex subunit 6
MTPPNLPPAALNGHGDFKGKGKEPSPTFAPVTSLPSQTRLPVGGPGEMINVAMENQGVSRLVDMSVACRYLAAQCQVRQGKWTEATEMLGEANPFRGSATSGPAVPNMDGGIKVRNAIHKSHTSTYLTED